MTLVVLTWHHERFNELGRALWQLQLDFRQNASEKVDWRFCSYICEADVEPNIHDVETKEKAMAGQMMDAAWLKIACGVTISKHCDITLLETKEWWDASSEAGPKSRPQSITETPVPALNVLVLNGQQVQLLGHLLRERDAQELELSQSGCLKAQWIRIARKLPNKASRGFGGVVGPERESFADDPEEFQRG